MIYEHENDAVRAAVTIAASRKPSSYAPTLAAATAELLTHLNPITHVPGNLLKDLFTEETAAAASKSLDSAGDRAIRDFCYRFGIDFEPVSGMFFVQISLDVADIGELMLYWLDRTNRAQQYRIGVLWSVLGPQIELDRCRLQRLVFALVKWIVN